MFVFVFVSVYCFGPLDAWLTVGQLGSMNRETASGRASVRFCDTRDIVASSSLQPRSPEQGVGEGQVTWRAQPLVLVSSLASRGVVGVAINGRCSRSSGRLAGRSRQEHLFRVAGRLDLGRRRRRQTDFACVPRMSMAQQPARRAVRRHCNSTYPPT